MRIVCPVRSATGGIQFRQFLAPQRVERFLRGRAPGTEFTLLGRRGKFRDGMVEMGDPMGPDEFDHFSQAATGLHHVPWQEVRNNRVVRENRVENPRMTAQDYIGTNDYARGGWVPPRYVVEDLARMQIDPYTAEGFTRHLMTGNTVTPVTWARDNVVRERAGLRADRIMVDEAIGFRAGDIPRETLAGLIPPKPPFPTKPNCACGDRWAKQWEHSPDGCDFIENRDTWMDHGANDEAEDPTDED
jgi:hypothetical protein